MSARWLDYAAAIRGRVVLDRGFARALWVVPWMAWRARRRRPGTVTARIAYHPQPAGPWYTLPLALMGTGVRTVRRVADADVVMAFDDRTRGSDPEPPSEGPRLNGRITDISKTHVADVFARCFGYPLAVDPTAHAGPMVEKSDINGVHDGRIVHGPLDAPRPGMVYQRLIDTTCRPGVTEELRCTCVGGRVSVAVRKEKADAARFAARYLSTQPVDAATVLSETERARIAGFLDAMGLDVGSIDVLRDRDDGRVYVVDVNKTCMPVLSLNWRALDGVLAQIGRDAEALILSRRATPPAPAGDRPAPPSPMRDRTGRVAAEGRRPR